MLTVDYLKSLCPIHISELSRITGESCSQLCLGWLRPYLQDGTFSFIDGVIQVKERD